MILTGQRKGSSDVVGHSGPVMALAVSSDGKYMVYNNQKFNLLFRNDEVLPFLGIDSLDSPQYLMVTVIDGYRI